MAWKYDLLRELLQPLPCLLPYRKSVEISKLPWYSLFSLLKGRFPFVLNKFSCVICDTCSAFGNSCWSGCLLGFFFLHPFKLHLQKTFIILCMIISSSGWFTPIVDPLFLSISFYSSFLLVVTLQETLTNMQKHQADNLILGEVYKYDGVVRRGRRCCRRGSWKDKLADLNTNDRLEGVYLKNSCCNLPLFLPPPPFF